MCNALGSWSRAPKMLEGHEHDTDRENSKAQVEVCNHDAFEEMRDVVVGD